MPRTSSRRRSPTRSGRRPRSAEWALVAQLWTALYLSAGGGDDSTPSPPLADAGSGADATTTSDAFTAGDGGALADSAAPTDAKSNETGTADGGDGGDGASLGKECRASGWCWENPAP